jgi:hypothetical protein
VEGAVIRFMLDVSMNSMIFALMYRLCALSHF